MMRTWATSTISAGRLCTRRRSRTIWARPTPLHFAAQEGSLEVAQLLLAGGVDVDRVDEHGNTPLMAAVFNYRGRGDLIELLRASGADPLRPNSSGQTPVAHARLIGNFDVAQYFTDVPGQ